MAGFTKAGFSQERVFTDIVDLYKPNEFVKDDNRFVTSIDYPLTPTTSNLQCSVENAIELTDPAIIGRLSRDNLDTADVINLPGDTEIGVGWAVNVRSLTSSIRDEWYRTVGEPQDFQWAAGDKRVLMVKATKPPQRDPGTAVPDPVPSTNPVSDMQIAAEGIIAATWGHVGTFFREMEANQTAWRSLVALAEQGESAFDVPFGVLAWGPPVELTMGPGNSVWQFDMSIYYIQSRRMSDGTYSSRGIANEAWNRLIELQQAFLAYDGPEFSCWDSAPASNQSVPGQEYFDRANMPFMASALDLNMVTGIIST